MTEKCTDGELAMKRVKSTAQDLREMFTQNIAVRHIAEPLASFDAEVASSTVLAFMNDHDYDVVGVRRDGLVTGYVERMSLLGAELPEAFKPFTGSDLVDDTTSLPDALSLMRDTPRLFVRVFGGVGGIVTRGDLQKAPVRMWLFGLISLTEMQLLRLVREAYPDNGWEPLLSQPRLEAAKALLERRQRENASVDLADCLQFCDKRVIVLRSEEMLAKISLGSKRGVERFLKRLESLRNNLAHAQDIVTGRWPDIVDLAEQAEAWLGKCEAVTMRVEQP